MSRSSSRSAEGRQEWSAALRARLGNLTVGDPATIPVTIEAAAASVTCARTRWEVPATLPLRYASVGLSNAVVTHPRRAHGPPQPLRPGIGRSRATHHRRLHPVAPRPRKPRSAPASARTNAPRSWS
ncbi:hypothetical protein [Embleya hyalina]|uniref:hypothetical protein n=1 Tax=Embleya hyalina TaxID=516124 RepID=UPI00353161B5